MAPAASLANRVPGRIRLRQGFHRRICYGGHVLGQDELGY